MNLYFTEISGDFCASYLESSGLAASSLLAVILPLFLSFGLPVNGGGGGSVGAVRFQFGSGKASPHQCCLGERKADEGGFH